VFVQCQLVHEPSHVGPPNRLTHQEQQTPTHAPTAPSRLGSHALITFHDLTLLCTVFLCTVFLCASVALIRADPAAVSLSCRCSCTCAALAAGHPVAADMVTAAFPASADTLHCLQYLDLGAGVRSQNTDRGRAGLLGSARSSSHHTCMLHRLRRT